MGLSRVRGTVITFFQPWQRDRASWRCSWGDRLMRLSVQNGVNVESARSLLVHIVGLTYNEILTYKTQCQMFGNAWNADIRICVECRCMCTLQVSGSISCVARTKVTSAVCNYDRLKRDGDEPSL